MKKTYCDICSKEITDDNKYPENGIQGTVTTKKDKLIVNILLSASMDTELVDWCKHCVIDAVKDMDDRNFARPSFAPTDFQGTHK